MSSITINASFPSKSSSVTTTEAVPSSRILLMFATIDVFGSPGFIRISSFRFFEYSSSVTVHRRPLQIGSLMLRILLRSLVLRVFMSLHISMRIGVLLLSQALAFVSLAKSRWFFRAK